MKKIILILLLLCQTCFAASFNFNSQGEQQAGEILRDFILQGKTTYDFDTIAYSCDIDNDGEKDIIGIVKSAPYYTIAGYQLFVLRKIDNIWQNVENDIFFDNYKDLTIDKGQITYHKSSFYGKGKYKAKYKDGMIKTGTKINDVVVQKKIYSIENSIIPTQNKIGQMFNPVFILM